MSRRIERKEAWNIRNSEFPGGSGKFIQLVVSRQSAQPVLIAETYPAHRNLVRPPSTLNSSSLQEKASRG
jgi:hypothetical protein